MPWMNFKLSNTESYPDISPAETENWDAILWELWDARQVDATYSSAEFPLILEIFNFCRFFFSGRKEVKHCQSTFAHIFAITFFCFGSRCGIQGSQHQPVLQNVKALVAKQITQGPLLCREFFFLRRTNLFSFQVEIKKQESHYC